MSMETRDQGYLDRTEVEIAIEYAEIAAAYDVPVTLFLTGRTAVEEPERVETLAGMDNVEIGGHNYWAFTTPVHTAWRALGKATRGRIGSWNGPKRFQSYEIRRTIEALESVGADVTTWRDHAYRHDRHTAGLLAEHGITHFSDAVGPDEEVRREDGVTIVPVNAPPDHEHVYHAYRTPEFVAASEFSGPFGSNSHSAEEWTRIVIESVSSTVGSDKVTTVLAHPSCMRLADGFTALDDLCETLRNQCELAKMREVTPSG